MIVGKNQKFVVGDHDFSKISIIPDVVLVHDIPHTIDPECDSEGGSDEDSTITDSRENSWYRGTASYSFKNMITEGSTALRGVVEMGNVVTGDPTRFFAITDGGGDRRVNFLSVEKSLISLFFIHDFDEVLVSRTAAGLSFRNPCERCHCIANIGLNGIGSMREKMNPDFEKLMKNKNTTDEIRTLCGANQDFKAALEASLSTPIEIMKEVFSRLSLKGVPFKVCDPANEDDLEEYLDVLKIFGDDINSLTEKKDLNKFPLFKTFLKNHTIERTYYFHVFKCSDTECKFHKPLRGEPPSALGDPVPYTDEEGTTHYKQGSDPEENYMPSKLEDITKRNHGMDFSPSAQTASNVGSTIKCSQYKKPRLMYSKKKLTEKEKIALKQFLSSYEYVCGSSFKEIPEDSHPNIEVIRKAFVRENLSCSIVIESPYYSCKMYQLICVKCGKSNKLLPPDVTFYPQCEKCPKERVKVPKRKAVTENDLNKKKQRKL